MVKLKVLLAILLSLFAVLFIPHKALAVCPVCTVAVGAGLGISRSLGIDDAVTSIWIGGLILSTSFWTIDWIEKKRKKSMSIKYQLLTIFLMYLIVILPLWYSKYIGRVANTFWGIDKIVFGTILGSLSFLASIWADKKIRKIKGKQLFNYQKIVFPITFLVIISLILFYAN